MLMRVLLDIDTEESGLDEEEVKDNIVDFARSLVIVGAAEKEVALAVKEVDYYE